MEDLEENYVQLMDLLVQITENMMPSLPPRKPGKLRMWNPSIAACTKTAKEAHWKWKQGGCSLDKDSQLVKDRQDTSKALRQEQRKESALRRERDFLDISQATLSNSTTAFKLVNKHKKDISPQYTSLQIGDRLLQTPDEVRNGWSNHFGALATPADKDKWDSVYHRHCCLEIESIYNLCRIRKSASHDTPELIVTRQNTRDAIQKLHIGKSPDFYGLTAEHLRYAGNTVVFELTHLINAIFQLGRIPDILKVGVVTPIFKKKKDKTLPTNYRGITVTPVILKLLEIVLRDNMLPILSPIQHPLQRGFTAGVSPLNAALILHETLLEFRAEKKPCFVAFLDMRAAFDTVSHPSMLRKLHHDSVTGDLWVLLSELYTNATSKVKWMGDYSKPFDIGQGVRQGSITSTEIFKRYNNKLIESVQQYGACCNVGTSYTGTPTCADDICLISESPVHLATALEIAEDYSYMERFDFQPSKSAVMHFDRKKKKLPRMEPTFTIGDVPIPVVESTTHIGITRDIRTNGLESTVKENIRKARNTLYHLMGAGLHGKNGLNPSVSFQLYKIYVLPVLLFGLEILLPTGNNLQQLELFHRKTLKQFLSLPNNTPEPALYALLGAEPITSLIHKRALTFYRNLCQDVKSTEVSLIDRQLAMKGFKGDSWVSDIRSILALYQLPSAHDILDSTPSKYSWKRQVYKAVNEYWQNATIRIGDLYSSLQFFDFSSFKFGVTHPALIGVQSTKSDIQRMMIKLLLLTGTYHLQSNRQAFNQYRVKTTCTLCKDGEDDINHFLQDCIAFQYLREDFIYQLSIILAGKISCHSILLHLNTLVLNPTLLVQDKELVSHLENISRMFVMKMHLHRQSLLVV